MGLIVGQLLCTDDLDMAFNRIKNWRNIDDLPTVDALPGQVIAFDGNQATWVSLAEFGPITWDDVQEKPTFVNAVFGGPGIAVSSNTGVVIISNDFIGDTQEPTGFVNTTDSTIVINNNRTFTIAPVDDEFVFYVQGVKYTKVNTESVTFPDVQGLVWFYYDETGTLRAANSITDGIFTQSALVAIANWEADTNTITYFGEERHGITMDGRTHEYLHRTEGTRFVEGHALTDINPDASGNDNDSATLSVESGTIADEDLILAAAGTVSSTQQWYVYYRSGPQGIFKRYGPTDYPVIPGTSGRLAWNEFSGGSWIQTDVDNNDFVNAHIWRVNSATVPYIAVQGQAEYNTLNLAREGALEEINNLVLTGISVVEFSPLGTIIYQTSNGYSNDVQARIRTNDLGEPYVDWRFEAIQPGQAPGDHGSLSGLADPDHPLTALQQSGATTNLGVIWNGSTWTAQPVVNSVTAGTNITVSATNGPGISIATITNPIFTRVQAVSGLFDSSATTNAVKFEGAGLEIVADNVTLIYCNTSAVTVDGPFDVTGEIYCSSTISASQFEVSGTLLRPVHLDGTGYSSGNVPTWNGTSTQFEPATPSGGGGTTLLEAVKASTESRVSTAVFADDADLQFAVDANGVYYIYGIVFYSAHTTPDFKLQFVTTTGNGTLRVTETHLFNSVAFGLAAARVSPGQGIDVQRMYCFHGVLDVAGASDTFKIQWAQNVSNASPSKIHAGSLMIGQKLA